MFRGIVAVVAVVLAPKVEEFEFELSLVALLFFEMDSFRDAVLVSHTR